MKKTLFCLTTLSVFTLSLSANPGNMQRGQRPEPPTSTEVATMALGDFDKDNNSLIDVNELTETLTFLHNNRPQRPQGNRNEEANTKRPQRAAPDHSVMAIDLISAFDLDGDNALNQTELVDMFEELHKNMPKPPHGMGPKANRP